VKTDNKLLRELLTKEELLLNNLTRNNAAQLEELLEDQCVEVSASGRRTVYHQGTTIGNTDGEIYIVSDSASLVELSDDCQMLLYVAGEVSKNTRVRSNRASVWRRTNGRWKIKFHQGTNCTD
jgi:hypothetical protein